MRTMQLSTNIEEITAYLEFSKDFNLIHRNPTAARRAALALMCSASKADPVLIDHIAWGSENFIVLPGAHATIKSLPSILEICEIDTKYSPSDITVQFRAPALVPIDRPLDMELRIDQIENTMDEKTIKFSLHGKSIVGIDVKYQDVTIQFAPTSALIWSFRADEEFERIDRSRALKGSVQTFVYNHPLIGNISDDPYIKRMQAGQNINLVSLLAYIPSALMCAPGQLKSNPFYQQMFSDLNRRVIEENQRRAESCGRYSKAFSICPEKLDGTVHAYCSQSLKFISPRGVDGAIFFADIFLYPEGISKNTGKHVFNNYGRWTTEEQPEGDNPFCTGQSDVIALHAYPRPVIEHALMRHEEALRTGKTGRLLP